MDPKREQATLRHATSTQAAERTAIRTIQVDVGPWRATRAHPRPCANKVPQVEDMAALTRTALECRKARTRKEPALAGLQTNLVRGQNASNGASGLVVLTIQDMKPHDQSPSARSAPGLATIHIAVMQHEIPACDSLSTGHAAMHIKYCSTRKRGWQRYGPVKLL